MWFTQDDQKRGTVGDARLKEIVQEIVLRVDQKELNQQDLERQSSDLIASIAKHFKYKKQEQFDPSSARDNPEILKMQNHIRFVNGCYQANEELLAFEGMLMQIKHEAQTKAIQALEQRLAAAREQKVAADTSIQQQLDKIKQLEMQMLMDQKAYHEKMLQDLLNYRNHLDNQLKFLAAQLIHSRVETAKEVKSELGKIPELKDLSDQQLDKVSNGWVLLEEIKTIKLAEIDEIIQQAEANAKQPSPGGMLFRQPKYESSEVLKLVAQKTQVIRECQSKKEELLKTVGISPTDAPNVVAKIDKEPGVKQIVEQHGEKAVGYRKKYKEVAATKEKVDEKVAHDTVQLDEVNNLLRQENSVITVKSNEESENQYQSEVDDFLTMDISDLDLEGVDMLGIDLDLAAVTMADIEGFSNVDITADDINVIPEKPDATSTIKQKAN